MGSRLHQQSETSSSILFLFDLLLLGLVVYPAQPGEVYNVIPLVTILIHTWSDLYSFPQKLSCSHLPCSLPLTTSCQLLLLFQFFLKNSLYNLNLNTETKYRWFPTPWNLESKSWKGCQCYQEHYERQNGQNSYISTDNSTLVHMNKH